MFGLGPFTDVMMRINIIFLVIKREFRKFSALNLRLKITHICNTRNPLIPLDSPTWGDVGSFVYLIPSSQLTGIALYILENSSPSTAVS